MSLTLRQQADALPLHPGVYLFKNTNGEVLYVGKAIRLRDRVRSYFSKNLAEERWVGLEQMMNDAVTLDHQLAGSEMEALLLEAHLIRQYKPKYNIRLRDDKSYALIRIDLSKEFPPISIAREKDLVELLARKKRERSGLGSLSQKVELQEFFGPYLSAHSVRIALKTIRKIWPFYDCTNTSYGAYEKMGLGYIFPTSGLHDVKGAIQVTKEEYRHNIDQIRHFLRGERQKVLQIVQDEMEIQVKEERFEQAARSRDRLQSLLHIQDMAETRKSFGSQERTDFYGYNPEADILLECYDISNISGEHAVGSQIVGIVREAKIKPVSGSEARGRFYLDKSRYRKFKIKTVEEASDTDMLREVLSRRMKRSKTENAAWALPDMIIVDGGKGQLSTAVSVRKELELTSDVFLGSVAKGPTRKRVDLHGTEYQKLPCMEHEAWLVVAELLREEAHRFAITYYRNTHRKKLLSS